MFGSIIASPLSLVQGNVAPMPLVRLCVLGAADSGKTSLINSWVNGLCPAQYMPTEDSTLYCRMVRIAPRQTEDDENSKEVPIAVLVELEDTYAWERSDGEDKYKQKRCAESLLNPRGRKKISESSYLPLSDQTAPTCDKFEPLTKKRNAYVVVFDVNNPETFRVAKDVCERVGQKHASPVYLVGNKIDKHRTSAVSNTVFEAQDFAARKGLYFLEVSALEYTRVRKLFRDAVEDVSQSEARGRALTVEQSEPPAGEGGMFGIDIGGLFGW